MQDQEHDPLDSDADEVVRPRASRRSGASSMDRMLAAVGVVLACSAAMFPWYVFFNPDKFGIHVEPMDRTRDLPQVDARNVFSVSPMALVSREDREQKVPDNLDPLTTATASDIGRKDPDGEPVKIEQPFPGGGFRLLHVSNGRAMIEDASGMFMVKIGSVLPDNSRVATLEQRNGKWVIITSTGAIYENQ
ncbi:flagellar protein [Agrobacterium vitis]|uniref:flagellar protein n=1 Tax=Agrobacterium vitis TaxID=373 RepID=UPI003908A46F